MPLRAHDVIAIGVILVADPPRPTVVALLLPGPGVVVQTARRADSAVRHMARVAVDAHRLVRRGLLAITAGQACQRPRPRRVAAMGTLFASLLPTLIFVEPWKAQFLQGQCVPVSAGIRWRGKRASKCPRGNRGSSHSECFDELGGLRVAAGPCDYPGNSLEACFITGNP